MYTTNLSLDDFIYVVQLIVKLKWLAFFKFLNNLVFWMREICEVIYINVTFHFSKKNAFIYASNQAPS
jgi:hypothetical protein